MKKVINKGLIVLMSLVTFVGCNNDSSSSSNTSSLITSTGELSEYEKIEVMLMNLRKGVKFDGTIHQKSTILTGDHGTPTGEVRNNDLISSFTFQSGEENAFARYVTYTLEDGTQRVMYDDQLFQGEDGQAYYYELNYDNKVTAFPVYNSKHENVNFGYYCLNPFSFLEAEDFYKVEGKENTYTLYNDKASVFVSNIFGDLDPAFYGIVTSLEFVIEGTSLKSFKVVPESIYDYTLDLTNLSELYFFLEQEANFIVSEVGTAKVNKPEARKEKNSAELDALQSAFSKYSGNNYTMNLRITYGGDKSGQVDYATYYYTGEHLYYSKQEKQVAPDVKTDILFYNEGGKYLVPYGYSDEDSETQVVFTKRAAKAYQGYSVYFTKYTYDDVNPRIDEVSSQIFDYNTTFKNYSVCDELLSDFASKAIVPQLNNVSSFLNSFGKSFKIKLNSDGFIDYVTFSYDYSDEYAVNNAQIRLTITDVGTTTLPYDLVIA